MNRQKLLLGALAFVLILVAWHYLGGDDEPTTPPGATAGRSHATDEEGNPAAAPVPAAAHNGRDKSPPPREVKDLRMAQLDQVPRSITPGRDPWRFYEPPPAPPKPPPPPSAEELERRRKLEEERLRKLREEQEKAAYIAAHTPPHFTLSYLGTFGPPTRLFAVFSDGKTIYNVREGERIAGGFVLSHIGYESVDVSYPAIPDAAPQRVAAGTAKPGTPGVPGANPGIPPR
ncbi:MAG TPA: hypothetical protein VMM92_16110 [Thermoanaerobaculia bacterium]|nr:hypothetical protein [Thermoanaerobaculia bacterium]